MPERNDVPSDSPPRFLGKREPARKPTLAVGDFLRVQEIPEHPPTLASPRTAWTMDHNDQAGTCVVASVNHSLQAIATNLGNPRIPWSDREILDLYRTQNPDFMGFEISGGTDADQGMIVQDFLSECIRRGHILAFAQIDHEDHELMRAATFVGHSIVTGEMLRTPHASQAVWDATSGSAWGGHATCTVAYPEEHQFACVTWGAIQPYTEAFAERHMDEAWFILTKEMIQSHHFRGNFDLPGFADAVADLTGGKVVVPVPVSPIEPDPVVPEPPVNPLDTFPYLALDAWSGRRPKSDTKYERKAKDAYASWRQRHRT